MFGSRAWSVYLQNTNLSTLLLFWHKMGWKMSPRGKTSSKGYHLGFKVATLACLYLPASLTVPYSITDSASNPCLSG